MNQREAAKLAARIAVFKLEMDLEDINGTLGDIGADAVSERDEAKVRAGLNRIISKLARREAK